MPAPWSRPCAGQPDDLNKLFEEITKVKTMHDHNSKSYPESSLSEADNVWSETSRPKTSDANMDDTSLYAIPGYAAILPLTAH